MLSNQTFKKLIDERSRFIRRLRQPSNLFTFTCVSLPKLVIKVYIGVIAIDSRRSRDISYVPFIYLSPTDDEKSAVIDELMRRCEGYHFKISKRYGGHVAEYYLKVDWDYWYKADGQTRTGTTDQESK